MFIVGVGTFLVSKEIYVLEHEFYTGVATLIAWGIIARLTGNDVKNMLEKKIAGQEQKLK